jgi:hypothetical protein
MTEDRRGRGDRGKTSDYKGRQNVTGSVIYLDMQIGLYKDTEDVSCPTKS